MAEQLSLRFEPALPAPGAIDIYPQPIGRAHITVRTERVNRLLGTALSTGEIVWVLNYWNLSGFIGGALLLVFYYAFTGIVQQYLWNRLNKIVFAEFAMIVVGAIALLFWLRPH